MAMSELRRDCLDLVNQVEEQCSRDAALADAIDELSWARPFHRVRRILAYADDTGWQSAALSLLALESDAASHGPSKWASVIVRMRISAEFVPDRRHDYLSRVEEMIGRPMPMVSRLQSAANDEEATP